MKLKLSNEKDVQILSASEAITSKDMEVLKAGVGNLFKNGKNKIILDISASQDISNDVLRELAVLDILARELSGRIVLAGVRPEMKTKIEHFAKPPVISCFDTRSNAIQLFMPASTDQPQPPLEEKPAPTKEEIRKNEIGEVGTLRKQIADLESENTTLKEQLLTMIHNRRAAPDASAYEDKIKSLELELDRILNQKLEKKT